VPRSVVSSLARCPCRSLLSPLALYPTGPCSSKPHDDWNREGVTTRSNARQIFFRTNDERKHVLIASTLIQKGGKRVQAAAVGRAAQEALVKALQQDSVVFVARYDGGSDLRARNAVC